MNRNRNRKPTSRKVRASLEMRTQVPDLSLMQLSQFQAPREEGTDTSSSSSSSEADTDDFILLEILI